MPVSVSTLTRLLSCRYLLLLLVLLNNLFLLLVLIQSIYHSILLLALATYSMHVIAVLGLVGGGFYSLVYLLSVIIARCPKLLYKLLLGNECTLAGKTKLPFGTIPLMLNCGEVTLQTPSGKVMTIVLESHTTHRAQDLTQTDVSTL